MLLCLLGAHGAELLDVLVRAVAVDGDVRERLLESRVFLVAQLDVGRAQVLDDALVLAHAGDGHDVGGLLEHPGKGNLRRGCALLVREPVQEVEQGLVRHHVFGGEAGDDAAHVVALVDVVLRVPAGEEAARERGERHKADAELDAQGQDVLLVHPESPYEL